MFFGEKKNFMTFLLTKTNSISDLSLQTNPFISEVACTIILIKFPFKCRSFNENKCFTMKKFTERFLFSLNFTSVLCTSLMLNC